MANIGAGLLDALQGVNASNAMLDGREDRAALLKQRERQDRLNSMQDEVAAGGLADYRRTRAGAEADRTTFAAAPDQAAGLAAVEAERQKRGDVAGSIDASKKSLELEIDGFKKASLKHQKELLPIEQQIAAGKLKFEAGAQPGLQALEGQRIQDALGASQENLMWRMWNIAKKDTGMAAKLLSESNVLFPGKKVGGITMSEDGQTVIILDDKGQVLTQVKRAYLDGLDQKFAAPKKLEVLKQGETGFMLNPATGKYEQQVSVDPANKYVALPENSPGTLNTTTGATTAAPGLSTGMSPQRRDARFKVAEQHIGNVLGGSFDSIGKLSLKPGTEAIYDRAAVLAEQMIAKGVDPAMAGSEAGKQAMREAKTGGASTGPGLSTAPTSTNWQDFAPQR